MRLVILTGASGSGKTAIAEAIQADRGEYINVLHFDSVGVPSPEAMATGWGSGEGWQHATTFDWMERIARLTEKYRAVLFEGQMRLSFIFEGIVAAEITDFKIILVDCNDESRTRRLAQYRNQPELANAQMMDWATNIRKEAIEVGCEIVDTSDLTLAASVSRVYRSLGAS